LVRRRKTIAMRHKLNLVHLLKNLMPSHLKDSTAAAILTILQSY